MIIRTTSAKRSARYRANNPEKTRESKARRYDADARRKYLSRRFVAVDGEGITVQSGRRKGRHDYVLLAISGVPPLYNPEGIPSSECFSYLWRNLNKENINVIFGGSYDFNSWLMSFNRSQLQRAYDGETVTFGPYKITWRKRKWFRISRDGRSVTVYDVVGFFQSSFVTACDEWLGDWPYRDEIISEKAKRSEFTLADIDTVSDYNGHELELLVMLCDELRIRLDNVKLRPRQWIGSGAVAASLLTREHVEAHMMRDVPAAVHEASKLAFAGGRFEPIRWGISNEHAYEYDIHSAYPDALQYVPSLNGGNWSHHTGHRESDFGIYHIRFRVMNKHDAIYPGPFGIRDEHGNVAYPMQGETWIWTPEMRMINDYSKIVNTRITVIECFTFTPSDTTMPFAFVPALFRERAALKASGDASQKAIKLAINSLYGKTVQQVGWDKKTRTPPKFHQLEWAGYITSHCRAKILTAAMENPDAVIAFETDAVFTSEPLDLPISDDLGDFERTQFDNITYAQSGLYCASSKGVETVKTRGVDRGQLSRDDIEGGMRSGTGVHARLTRYNTAGIALAQSFEKWRTWTVMDKLLTLRPSGKRVPLGPLRPGLNHTWCPIAGGTSAPYPLEWDDDNMVSRNMARLRDEPQDYDMER